MDERELLALLPRLRRYARALTGARAEADDLVQDTLERAWVRASKWRAGGDLRVWLFAIMHNLWVDQLRRTPAGLRSIEDDGLDLPTRATQSDRMELVDLDSALQQLPGPQQAVLLLVSLEEMSYAQVAETLSLPIGTVMSRLARARENLRRLIDSQPNTSHLRVVR